MQYMKTKLAFIVACALFFGSTANLAMDIYIPSLPAIARSLHATINLTQLSVAAFVGGVSIARLIFGIISDAIGRRSPIIVGAFLAVIGSIMCLYAPNIYILIAGRFLQGLGAGGINVIGRVILSDVSDGARLAQYMSYFSMTGISLTIFAPLFGGYLQHFFEWRSVFLVLVIYMVIALFAALFVFHETNIYKSHEHIQLPIIWNNMKKLFTSRSFLISIGLLPLAFACMLVWETVGPIILQNIVGLTPVQFGWISALVALCYLSGVTINGQIVRRFGVNTMMRIGTFGMLLGAVSMLVPALFHYINGYVIIIPMMIVMLSISFVIPNSYAKGMHPFAHIAGIAVAILGSIQVAGSFVSSTLIAFLPDNSQLPLAGFLLVLSLLSILMGQMSWNDYIE
jgi:Bcr/CflA subfamily drug resistance transporter